MFTKIDLDKWDRAEYYNHFMNNVGCVYNITANIDITLLYEYVKEKNVKIYPTLIYMLTTVVNRNKEFRLGVDEQNCPGEYDVCHPSYTITNAREGSFSGIWAFATENYKEFYQNYLIDKDKYSKSFEYAPKADQPYNTFYVSCTPDIAFTSLSLTLFKGQNSLTPMFTIGKFLEQNGHIMLPLSSCLHHAACDGSHAAKLYQQMQALAENVKDWLII